jgi:hypothetical protein
MGPEHPSPNSVLDGSVYKDDLQSPVMQTPKDPKGNLMAAFHILVSQLVQQRDLMRDVLVITI